MNRFSAAAAWFFQPFSRFIRALVGDISWRPPDWAGAVKAGAVRRPILSVTSILGLVALVAGGCWAWNWYAHQPKPEMVGWIVNLADAPEPGTEFQAQNLTLAFDKSVAKLESIGKQVNEGVTLSPPMKGTWTWAGGSYLIFEPTEVWPAATTFRVKLARSLFSPHARFETLNKEFHTSPFTVAISEMRFYVNPKDPASKQVTATLTFSHPVDHASLEKNLTLAMESGEQVFKDAPSATGRCTVTYDKLDRVAYVRSVNVAVPKESGHAILTLPDSVTTVAGQAHLSESKEAQVVVPSASDLFHVALAKTVIATNKEGEPEQALVLTTSVGVKPEMLAGALHAWILPPPKKHEDAESGDEVAA